MCSRAFAACLSLSLAGCASDETPASSDTSSLTADSACGPTNWHMLHGPSLGHGDKLVHHQEPEIELDVESSEGFEVGRSSVVRAAPGNQVFVEIKNIGKRWRCGVRSFPYLAYDAQGARVGQPFSGDIGFTVLGGTGINIRTREGAAGDCLGPSQTGYLQIALSKELAKVSIRMEASGDDLELGPPPTCVVPDTYTYGEGSLRIRAHRAGTSDPTYKPSAISGLAMVLAMDDDSLPVAWFALTPDSSGETFTGAINLTGGTSNNLAVSIW